MSLADYQWASEQHERAKMSESEQRAYDERKQREREERERRSQSGGWG